MERAGMSDMACNAGGSARLRYNSIAWEYFISNFFLMKALALFLLVFVSVSMASAQPVVVIVRHAEKVTNGGSDADLSSAGRARADALARILKDSGITAIFTTEFKRTQETAAPIATSTHVVPTVVAAKDTAVLVAKLHQLSGNALVVAHGDTIPNIIKALGINSPINIPDEDYSEFLIVTLGDKPQLFRLHYPL
jgi:phosphohistidine phosphatase SixA